MLCAQTHREVLNNDYHELSIDNWNSTLLKATEFKKTFECEKLRTKQSGCYQDHVFGYDARWKKCETPSIKEIMVLKLYTDWDLLQFELKKCFRLECADVEVLRRNQSSEPLPLPDLEAMTQLFISETPKWTPSPCRKTQSTVHDFADAVLANEAKSNQLERRLSHFYHWRGSLLICINKYSTILSPTFYDKKCTKQFEFLLYCGVNSKMILNPSATNSFYGPLSTSSSYHVAQTFATDKGMVLSIGSQYPRLRMCNAFDASSMSDYPEEQEYLIGHVYLRIRKIYIKTVPDTITMDSKIRLAFFAMHLFRRQVFSMNHDLQKCIIPFIQIYLLKVRHAQTDTSLYSNLEKSKDYQYLSQLIQWYQENEMDESQTPEMDSVVMPSNKQEAARKSRVFYILTKYFADFCNFPNQRQVIRIDCVSLGLRQYFSDETQREVQLPKVVKSEVHLKDNKMWSVSFRKIVHLFPNIHEIHFLNWWLLDNAALQRLIREIGREDNKLRQIKFMYYDFNDPLSEHPWFFDPQSLKKALLSELKSLNWRITFPKKQDRRAGYIIKLKAVA